MLPPQKEWIDHLKIEKAPIIQKTAVLNKIAANVSTIPFSENNSLQGSQSTSAISP